MPKINQLVISEKPKTAKAIAAAFNVPRQKGKALYYQNNEMTIVPAFGHLFELYDFKDYDPALAKWSADTIPFIPSKFKIKLTDNPGVKRQYNLIEKFHGHAKLIINAGDNDREGQYLIDEILDYLGNQKPTKRFLPQGLSAAIVRKGFENLRDNSEFANQTQAAIARNWADWLIGLNVTRALTIAAQLHGLKLTLSGGRVQSVAVALVVDRDREIEKFVPVDFFVPQITVGHPQGDFVANWIPNTNHPVDSEKLLIDRSAAQKIIDGLKGQSGTISSVKKEQKTKAPHLPHTQASLAHEASKRFGYGVKKSEDTCQSIYEKGLVTYPRTNNPHMDEAEFDLGVEKLKALASHGIKIAQNADPTIKSKAWKKASASDNKYAIIPTGERAGELTDAQQNIYNLIVERYVMQFYPPMIYESQQIITTLGGETWKTTGTRVISPGWTVLQNRKVQDEDLPKVIENDDVTCKDAVLKAKKTTPPKYWTESELQMAMENIHRIIKDPRIKKIFRENAGIGTESTRPSTIALIKDDRGYIENFGKKTQIRSTKIGRVVRDVLPKSLTDPITTAGWDEFLKLIEEGEQTLENFMKQTIAQLPEMVATTLKATFPKELVGEVHHCPTCGGILTRYKYKKKEKKGFFWACYNEEQHKDGKPVFLPDVKGRPGEAFVPVDTSKLPKAPCPELGCDKQMTRFESRKTKGLFYFRCENKDHPLRYDDEGKPGDVMRFGKKKAN